jgi:predicted small metal-binding protein
MFKLACGDVMPGCPARFENTDRDVLLARVAGHAADAHGITDITPDVRQAIVAKIAS